MSKNQQQQIVKHAQNLIFLLTGNEFIQEIAIEDTNNLNGSAFVQKHQRSNIGQREELIIRSKTGPTISYYEVNSFVYCEKLMNQHQINHPLLMETYQDLSFTQIVISDLKCGKQVERKEYIQSQYERAAKEYSTNKKENIKSSIAIYQQILVYLPQNLGALNNLALAYRQQNELVKSKQTLQKAIKIHPSSHQLYLNYASTLLMIDRRASNLEFIIQTLQKSLEIEPNQYQAHHNLGYLYKYQKQYQKSIQEFNIAIKMDPFNYISYYGVASIYKQVHQNQLSLNNILKCLRLKEGHHQALICLGNILMKLYLKEETVKLQEQLCIILEHYTNQKDYFSQNQTQKIKCIFKIYDKCNNQGYSSIQLFYGLGNICLFQKKYRKAITYFTKILDQNSQNQFGYYGIALSYYYLKQFNESLSNYSKAFQKSQDQYLSIVIGYIFCILKSQSKVKVIENLYSIVEKIENSDELVCYFKASTLEGDQKQQKIKQGLSKSRNQEKSLKIIADIMFELEDYSTACIYYKKFMENNRFPLGDYFIGRCCQEEGDRIIAVNYYIKQLKIRPSDQQTLYKIAEIYYSLKFSKENYQIIYSLIKIILQINPQSIKSIFLLSRLQMDQHHHDKRLILLRKIYMIDEYSGDSSNSLALGFLSSDQQYECFRYLTKGINKAPKNLIVLQNLACLELLTKKKQSAIQNFNKAYVYSENNLALYLNYQGQLQLRKDYYGEKPVKLFYISLRMIIRDKIEEGLKYFFVFLNKKHQVEKNDIKNYDSTMDFMIKTYCSKRKFLKLIKFLLVKTFQGINQSINAFHCLIKKNSEEDDYIFRLMRFNSDLTDAIIDQQFRNELYYIILELMFHIDEYEALKANQFFCSVSPSFCNRMNRINIISKYNEFAIDKIGQLINDISYIINSSNKSKIQPLTQTTKSSYSSAVMPILSLFQKAEEFKLLILSYEQQISINDLSAALNNTDHNNLHIAMFDVTHLQFKKYKQIQQQIMVLSQFIGQYEKDYLKKLKESTQNYDFIKLKAAFMENHKDHFFNNISIKFLYNSIYLYIDEKDRIKLLQFFWDIFNNQCLLKLLSIIQQIQKYIKEKSLIVNSLGSKIDLSFENQSDRSTKSDIDQQNYRNRIKITSIILSQAQNVFFNNWSQQSQNSFNENFIENSCINPTNDQPQYLRIKHTIEKQYGYNQICLLFRQRTNLIQQSIKNADRQSLYLQPINNNNILQSQAKKQSLNFQKIMRQSKQYIFNFIHCLFHIVKELNQFQIYHLDISIKGMVQDQNTYKLIDFDHCVNYSQNSSMLQKIIQSWLQYRQQQQTNVIKYIFKFYVTEILAKLTDFRSNNPKMDLNTTVKLFRSFFREYSIDIHTQQINEIISNMIELDKAKGLSIFTLKDKSKIFDLLKSDFVNEQKSKDLEYFSRYNGMKNQVQKTL